MSERRAVNEIELLELQKHFDVPEGEILKGAWTCTLKHSGGVVGSNGKLYITNTNLYFYNKGVFTGYQRKWGFQEILDLDKVNGKYLRLLTVNNKKYVFTNFDNLDKTTNVLQRVLFGFLGNSALHQAVEQKDYDRVRQILENDPSKLNVFNRNEHAPLHIALIKNDATMVKLLLEYYAKHPDICDINLSYAKAKNGFLHSACSMPLIDDEILLMLINFERIDVTLKNADDNTPLHYFCEHNHSLNCKRIGTALIQRSGNPKEYTSAKNRNNETAVHKACWNKKVRGFMLELLIKFDAPLDVKNHLGETPLHYAIRLGREDLTRTLLKAGADTNIRTQQGQTPLELASEYAKGGSPESMAIVTVLQHVEEMKELLGRVGLTECVPRFIREELYEPEALAAIDEKLLNKLKIDIKVGPQIKLMKELEQLRKRLEEKKRRETELKKTRNRPPDEDDDEQQIEAEDAARVREELGIGYGEWEIDSSDLEYTKKLGTGASGKVYKGLLRGKIEVAIKVLTAVQTEEAMEEFKKEFQIMTTVKSPYMITFYGASIEPKLCMVMEYAARGSLYHVLNDKRNVITWDQMFGYALDMAHGIDALHTWSPPIVHRDLKSLNLLVTGDNRVKVADFGLSRFTAGSNLDTFKKPCGTFAYCAPEIITGGTFTAKSDVYSMGIVLWELLHRVITGKYLAPYAEHNLKDYMILIQVSQANLRPTIPESSPPELKKLISDCVQPSAEDRPTSAEVVTRLKEIRKLYRKNKEKWDALLPPQ